MSHKKWTDDIPGAVAMVVVWTAAWVAVQVTVALFAS